MGRPLVVLLEQFGYPTQKPLALYERHQREQQSRAIFTTLRSRCVIRPEETAVIGTTLGRGKVVKQRMEDNVVALTPACVRGTGANAVLEPVPFRSYR